VVVGHNREHVDEGESNADDVEGVAFGSGR